MTSLLGGVVIVGVPEAFIAGVVVSDFLPAVRLFITAFRFDGGAGATGAGVVPTVSLSGEFTPFAIDCIT